MWQVFLGESCKSIFGNSWNFDLLHVHKQGIHISNFYLRIQGKDFKSQQFHASFPKKFSPGCIVVAIMAKPNLWVLGKTKQLLDPNLQIATFFRVYEQNVANKNHTNHTNHASSNLPIYKNLCPRNSAINHQPSKNSGHQDVKQPKWPTHEAQQKGIGSRQASATWAKEAAALQRLCAAKT